MSKIIVSFEDMKDGTVKIVCRPKLEQIAQAMMKEHRKQTAAEAYVFKAMHAVREASKRLDRLGDTGLIKSVFGG